MVIYDRKTEPMFIILCFTRFFSFLLLAIKGVAIKGVRALYLHNKRMAQTVN